MLYFFFTEKIYPKTHKLLRVENVLQLSLIAKVY